MTIRAVLSLPEQASIAVAEAFVDELLRYPNLFRFTVEHDRGYFHTQAIVDEAFHRSLRYLINVPGASQARLTDYIQSRLERVAIRRKQDGDGYAVPFFKAALPFVCRTVMSSPVLASLARPTRTTERVGIEAITAAIDAEIHGEANRIVLDLGGDGLDQKIVQYRISNAVVGLVEESRTPYLGKEVVSFVSAARPNDHTMSRTVQEFRGRLGVHNVAVAEENTLANYLRDGSMGLTAHEARYLTSVFITAKDALQRFNVRDFLDFFHAKISQWKAYRINQYISALSMLSGILIAGLPYHDGLEAELVKYRDKVQHVVQKMSGGDSQKMTDVGYLLKKEEALLRAQYSYTCLEAVTAALAEKRAAGGTQRLVR